MPPNTRGSSKKGAAPEDRKDEPRQLTSFSDLIDNTTDGVEQNGGDGRKQRASGDATAAPTNAKKKSKSGKKVKVTEESTAENAIPAASRQTRANIDEPRDGTAGSGQAHTPKAKIKKSTGKTRKSNNTEDEAKQATTLIPSDTVSVPTEANPSNDEAPPRPSTPLRETHASTELHPKTPKFDPDVHGAEIDDKDVYNAEEETSFISPKKKIILPLGVSPPVPASTVLTHIDPVVSNKDNGPQMPTDSAQRKPVAYQKQSRPATPVDPEYEHNAFVQEAIPITSTNAPPEAEIQDSESIQDHSVDQWPIKNASMPLDNDIPTGMPAAIQTDETPQAEPPKKNELVEVTQKTESISKMPTTQKRKAVQAASSAKTATGVQARGGPTAPTVNKESVGKETKKPVTSVGKPPLKDLKKREQTTSKPITKAPKIASNPISKAPGAKEQSKTTASVPLKKPASARPTSTKPLDARATRSALPKEGKEKGAIAKQDKSEVIAAKARSYGNLKENNKPSTGTRSDPTSSSAKRTASLPTSPKAERRRTASGSSKGSNAPSDRPRVPSIAFPPPPVPVKSNKPPTVLVGFKLLGEELAKKQAANREAAREARDEKRKKQEEEEKEKRAARAKRLVPKPINKPSRDGANAENTQDSSIAKEASITQKTSATAHVRKPSVTKTERAQAPQASKARPQAKPNGAKPVAKSTPVSASAPKGDTAKVDANKAAAENARALARQRGIESVKAWEQEKLGSQLDIAKTSNQNDKPSNTKLVEGKQSDVYAATSVAAPIQSENIPQ